jgi:mannose-6-phosphate isomerase-like protein (cupin superfamily)
MIVNIKEVIQVWSDYAATVDNWEDLVEGVEPKSTECGPVYEPPSPLDRPEESFAVADMRAVKVAEPHCHTNGETEIYIVLTGLGLTVIGGEEIEIKQGSVVVTPQDTAHFTIPKENLVMMVINTPPFNPANNVPINETNLGVGFDRAQYDRLVE